MQNAYFKARCTVTQIILLYEVRAQVGEMKIGFTLADKYQAVMWYFRAKI